jgi:hypothetical protein
LHDEIGHLQPFKLRFIKCGVGSYRRRRPFEALELLASTAEATLHDNDHPRVQPLAFIFAFN